MYRIPDQVRQETHRVLMPGRRRPQNHTAAFFFVLPLFFHQFTLIFDELKREKYVDWYGYSASVSPYILERFEKEAGYRFRPEYIIDQGGARQR